MHADTTFYDQLTPFYHLNHQDWDRSIERQRQQLSALIEREWLDAQRSLFASQQGMVQVCLAYLQNQVALYKTLGGGAGVEGKRVRVREHLNVAALKRRIAQPRRS